jgi:hypothetical protein
LATRQSSTLPLEVEVASALPSGEKAMPGAGTLHPASGSSRSRQDGATSFQPSYDSLVSPTEELLGAMRAVACGHDVTGLVRQAPHLALAKLSVGATRATAAAFYLGNIGHYVYVGDTLLHAAGAAYASDVARILLDAGADVGARNRRGARPLHYAADGNPGSPTWNPSAQGRVITLLIEAGADPNALDKSGVAPLHRAVRTRCTGAVRALLAGGADPRLRNRSGSTPLDLAEATTGRGGSGSDAAKREQRAIKRLLSGDSQP